MLLPARGRTIRGGEDPRASERPTGVAFSCSSTRAPHDYWIAVAGTRPLLQIGILFAAIIVLHCIERARELTVVIFKGKMSHDDRENHVIFTPA